MRVLVTGATGFVGFHTSVALQRAGHSVRLGIRNVDKMQQLYQAHGIEVSDFAVGAITDEEAVAKALDGCDAVVHTAAMVSMDPSLAETVRQTNVRGTELVVGGAVQRGIEAIVYVSSVTAIYDRHAQTINEDSSLGEATSGYGRSKIECEKYVRGLIAGGAPVAITYPSMIVGPDDPMLSEGNQGVAYFIHSAVPITTTGAQFTDVRDLAQAHVKLLEGRKSGSYVVGGGYLTWRELYHALNGITARKVRKIPMPRFLFRIIGSLVDAAVHIKRFDTPISREAVTYTTEWVVVDDSKLHRELDLDFHTVHDTLRDTVEWLATAGHIDRSWVRQEQS